MAASFVSLAGIPHREFPGPEVEPMSLSSDGQTALWPFGVEQQMLPPLLEEASSSRDELSRKQPKVSTTGLIAAHGGAPRRRAAQACFPCGKRKIRCDVVDQGPPCSNCKFDNVDCVVPTRSKRRRLDDSAKVGGPPDLNSASEEHILAGQLNSERTDVDGIPVLNPFWPMPLDAPVRNQHVPHLICKYLAFIWETYEANFAFDQMHGENAQDLVSGGTEEGNFPNHMALQFPTQDADLLFWNDSVDDTIAPPDFVSANILPLYVKPLPKTVNEDDIEYLSRRGALSIPEAPLRKKLLHSYAEHVHGQMPILELNDFLRVVDSDDGKIGQVSLLLFQCVMFAAASFVDLKHLQDAGFPSRFAARKALFLKARGLYDLDCEMDAITLVQSLLLMTLWYETPDDQKDMWYWSGVTTSLSLLSGLHRPVASQKDIKTQRLWKRIGWSCFIRDQLVTLGTQRPTRVKTIDHALSMLAMEDFELEPLPWDVSCIGFDRSLARDATRLRIVAILNIEMAKLSLCLSRVLATQYTGLSPKQGGGLLNSNAPRTSLLVPKIETEGAKDFLECVHELDLWLSQRPEETRYPGPITAAVEDGEESIMVYRAMLDMLYNTSVIMLLGPQSFKEETKACNDAPAADDSASKVRNAAHQITNTGQDLLRLNILHLIPGYGVSFLIAAAMTHLRGVQSPNIHTKSTSVQGLRECMVVLQSVRNIHPGADVFLKILEFTTGKTENVAQSNKAGSADELDAISPILNRQEQNSSWQDSEFTAEEQRQILSFIHAGSGATPEGLRGENAIDTRDMGIMSFNVPPGNKRNSETLSDDDTAMDMSAVRFGTSAEAGGDMKGEIDTEWEEYATNSQPRHGLEHEPAADSFGGLLQEMEVMWTKFS